MYQFWVVLKKGNDTHCQIVQRYYRSTKRVRKEVRRRLTGSQWRLEHIHCFNWVEMPEYNFTK